MNYNDRCWPNELDPEAIQYEGTAGITKDCVDAVFRHIYYRDDITHARILTCKHTHALMFCIGGRQVIAIKAGFSSGYPGEGPDSFSLVLSALESLQVKIDETNVPQATLDRLNSCRLNKSDYTLVSEQELSVQSWSEYILSVHCDAISKGILFNNNRLRHVMPYHLIDPRLLEEAVGFFANPDMALINGYRRLEDIVRKRTKSSESSSRLFSNAFNLNKGPLVWKDVDEGESTGRMQLFCGAYTAFRNPRLHKELDDSLCSQLSEFLLLNLLYGLEKSAIERT